MSELKIHKTIRTRTKEIYMRGEVHNLIDSLRELNHVEITDLGALIAYLLPLYQKDIYTVRISIKACWWRLNVIKVSTSIAKESLWAYRNNYEITK